MGKGENNLYLQIIVPKVTTVISFTDKDPAVGRTATKAQVEGFYPSLHPLKCTKARCLEN